VGEIDIDSELVAASQKLDGKEEARIMMLNNGCLCCTVRDDLVDMLTELVRWPAGSPYTLLHSKVLSQHQDGTMLRHCSRQLQCMQLRELC
jgi:CobW/HypB/UreG, nucleotide-binding domain